MRRLAVAVMLAALTHCGFSAQRLEQGFRDPPDTARPWVFWFWINGNISHEGITRDLEAMKAVGINGVLWMEVSGPWWAPQGAIVTGSAEWHRAMQWALGEADRLKMEFALSVDCGYGSGGTHITPDISMQQLVWSITRIDGGTRVALKLARPKVDYTPSLKKAWLRPGQSINPKVLRALREVDSYRDVAVIAVRPSKKEASIVGELRRFDGRADRLPPALKKVTGDVEPLHPDEIIDLTDRMSTAGHLDWNAPEGPWSVIRLGYSSNFKMTRPVPSRLVGLECDRLHPRGINTHFENWLKPIIEGAGPRAGRTLRYIHVDSWEAGYQNWTRGFREEFRRKRGYEIDSWLPALTGRIVENTEKTERFFWDMRQTVNELFLESYFGRLKELIQPYGIQFSSEPYGRLCVNNLEYAGLSKLPIAEFWTLRAQPPYAAKNQPPTFPSLTSYWYQSMKGIASVANSYGKARVGAEAFTGCRGWVDHPYLIKGMGDEAFCEGISHYIFHLSAHQAYDHMKPGLTHRRWGQHINRHQPWWPFSKPYFEYVARCQYVLQQGRRVVDVACLYHDGAPLNFNDIRFSFPEGYDYDFCTPEIIHRMQVRNGRIHLPTGVSYHCLLLPASGRLTLPIALKVEELKRQGASVYQQTRITGTPGLEGYPQADRRVKDMAAKWPLLPQGGIEELLVSDQLEPDFEGRDVKWIHRRIEGADLYFVANTTPKPMTRNCTFRTTATAVELWDPESGEIYALDTVHQSDGRRSVALRFEPSQSWFVAFRDKPSTTRSRQAPFTSWEEVHTIAGEWALRFDPEWGPKQALTFNNLISWSEHSDPRVKYYSGIAVYRKSFDLPDTDFRAGSVKWCLDLGKVDVMARVTLNGKKCGIAWKPPYQVDISTTLRPGKNELEIEVVNTWVNRMIGDEQLPLDAKWKDWETLLEWPEWFKNGEKSPTGRYTFTTARHYSKNSPLMPSGMLGPVRIMAESAGAEPENCR